MLRMAQVAKFEIRFGEERRRYIARHRCLWARPHCHGSSPALSKEHATYPGRARWNGIWHVARARHTSTATIALHSPTPQSVVRMSNECHGDHDGGSRRGGRGKELRYLSITQSEGKAHAVEGNAVKPHVSMYGEAPLLKRHLFGVWPMQAESRGIFEPISPPVLMKAPQFQSPYELSSLLSKKHHFF
jgi:hypothetical protein